MQGFDEATLLSYFEQFDTDGSGLLDRSEIMACMVHFFPNDSPSLMQARVKAADTNGDGQLDFEEFKKIVAESCGQNPYGDIEQRQVGGDAYEQAYENDDDMI